MVDGLSPEALRVAVDQLGFELVDVRITGPASRRAIRLRIDVPGGGGPGAGVTSDDCSRVSRALEAELEASGLSVRDILEVSSPGIERPVRFVEHWRRYVGREVRITATGVRGARVATILGVPDDGHVELQLGQDSMRLPLEAVREATLVVDWAAFG